MTAARCDLIDCSHVADKIDSLSLSESFAGKMSIESRSERKCSVQLILRNAQNTWLYETLDSYAQSVNRDFRFRISGISEPMQLITYTVGGHIGWHIDTGVGPAASRKLSISIQLSDGDTYAGGDLEFPDGSRLAFGRTRGATLCFPSYLYHRITPITQGTRRAIVAWVHGTPFN